MNNREIKFRMWNDKEMKYGIERGGQFGFCLNSFKCQQYTGLKDKNGKEIYEGDILNFGYPTTLKYDSDDDTFRLPLIVVIDFQGGAFWFTGDGYTDCNWHFYNAEDREVIGNIYEHPHLIKHKKQ